MYAEPTLVFHEYFNKWDKARAMGADHDINIPFTRGLDGPTDYHLGGFVMKITPVQDI